MRVFRMSKLEPEEVFNPRGEYYEEMYVRRPDYERQFINALKNDMCVLVHGQSGTGKTWLSRRVLKEEDFYYKPINLASASNFNSIYTCFKNVMIREGWQIRTKYSETKKANVSVGVADGGLSHISEYTSEVDYFMEFLKFMRNRVRNTDRRRYIIFENFESIIDNNNLIKELTNLITLIDDDEVMKYNTKFIIIGATGDIQDYFTSITNTRTIENRIIELPEIRTLTTQQTFELVERGFKKLDIKFGNESVRENYKEKIAWVTGGVPQRLHEYCLALSRICKENDWEAKNEFLEMAQKIWITTSLNKNYACLNRMISHDKTSVSTKNQVLYCLGLKEKDKFSTSEIIKDMYEEFPNSICKSVLKIAVILNELCQGNTPVLYRDDEIDEYRFSDMKFLLCMRSMLYKDRNEMVSIYDFGEI